ncbi:endonuclease/exonuclease/phosphatase family protein [Nocardioides sp. Root190]|uniref:endonuclease/exonuclease/phosphatase family protein n=1 Tax=Nocardioides sp. Root190 TaxID=1736488 RepID=UPI0009EC47BE|nr:endonuclease/exonuclease/phosphatase family protein [Nocardioides sp. Root190]
MTDGSINGSGRVGVRRLRRLVSGIALAGLVLAVAPALEVGEGEVHLAAAATCPTTRPVQMVEANIKSGMTKSQTAADLAKVFLDRPDFVAFNEVAARADSVLAPKGYAIWRTPGRYTGANPVVWRTDRWNAVAQGTMYVSNQPGKTATQTTELGLRYANWVTLRSVDGCQRISVVSYHVAPKTTLTANLLLPSVKRLGALATSLAADGPVLLAGDLNRHYRSKEYPRSTLAAYGMTPTWDMTGTMLPTGDHQGATIDFIFVRNAAQFSVTKQVTRELNSDHDAVVANLRFDTRVAVPRTAVSFVRGHVVNLPVSRLSEGRRAVMGRIIKAVQLAPKGSTMLIGTARLADETLLKALVDAHRRGVNVRVVSWSAKRSFPEKALMQAIGMNTANRSWAIRRPYSKAGALPPSALVFSTSAGVKLLAIQVDQPLDYRMVERPGRGQVTLEEADFVRLRTGISRQIR